MNITNNTTINNNTSFGAFKFARGTNNQDLKAYLSKNCRVHVSEDVVAIAMDKLLKGQAQNSDIDIIFSNDRFYLLPKTNVAKKMFNKAQQVDAGIKLKDRISKYKENISSNEFNEKSSKTKFVKLYYRIKSQMARMFIQRYIAKHPEKVLPEELIKADYIAMLRHYDCLDSQERLTNFGLIPGGIII